MTSARYAEQAVELKSCRYVNIKPGRAGGLTNTVAIHDIFHDVSIPCWVGGMLESATGGAICSALGMLDYFTYPADIFPSSRFYHQDLSCPPLELHRSEAGLPSVCPFNSISEPVPEQLKKLTVQYAVVE